MLNDFSKPYEYRSPKLVPCPHCHRSGSEDGIMGVTVQFARAWADDAESFVLSVHGISMGVGVIACQSRRYELLIGGP